MKKTLIILAIVSIATSFVPVSVEASMDTSLKSASELSNIKPRADIIEWRYNIINGKMYKRQFNYTKNQWIGKWILVG